MDAEFEPAMEAAYGGEIEAFTALVAAHPELVHRTSTTSHPSLLQFVAVEGGLARIPGPTRFAKVLLEAGAAPAPASIAAASVGCKALLEQLLDAGADVEFGAPWTALEEALYWCHTTIARGLRDERGARVASLRAAAALGEDIERFLLADGRLSDDAGGVVFPFGAPDHGPGDVLAQALIISLRNRAFESAARLVAHGADVDAMPPGFHEECSALHMAVSMNAPDVVDWLLVRGADRTLLDLRFTATAADWARHLEHPALAERIDTYAG